jgi:GT2 family glycosyltransferase
MNQAFAATSTSYVLMLNPDVRATTGAIARLKEIMEGNTRAGAVGGYVNDQYLPRNLPTPSTLIRQNLGLSSKNKVSETPDVRIVEQPAAAALLIRRDAYDEIGGFDERFYPAWYEDVDFCNRLKSAGWEIYFAADAEFLHEGGYGAEALGLERFAEAYYRNQLRYAHKHFGRAAALSVRLSITAGMLGRMVVHPRTARAHFKTFLGALNRW